MEDVQNERGEKRKGSVGVIVPNSAYTLTLNPNPHPPSPNLTLTITLRTNLTLSFRLRNVLLSAILIHA